MAICSRSQGEYFAHFRNFLAMFQSIGKYSKGKRLYFRRRFFQAGTISQDTGQINDLGQPTTILFLLSFN